MKKIIFAALLLALLPIGVRLDGYTFVGWRVVPAYKYACAFPGGGGGYPCGSAGSGANYSLTGPSTGSLNIASSNFTVQGTTLPSVTVTPADTSHGGVFSPTSLAVSGSGPFTFTYTPLQAGIYNISTTNSGVLSNPAPISFTVNDLAPGYPGLTSGWNLYHTTMITGGASDPFGGTNTATLTEDTTTDYHFLYSNNFTVVSGQQYTISLMVKAGTGTRLIDIRLRDASNASAFGIGVTPNTCTGSPDAFGGATIISSTLSTANLGAGWCLAQVKGTLGAYTSANMQFLMINGSAYSYAGDGTSSIQLYGPVVQ